MRFTRLSRIATFAFVVAWPAGQAGAATSLISTTPSWTAESNLTNTYFGTSVRTAGDVNGDGYSDVIVGSATYSNGQTSEGKAFLYLGSAVGLGATPAWSAEGEQAGTNFGITVSTAGDVNGDGFDDVIIGAPGRDNGQTDEGQAFVYLGSASGLAATAAWSVESNVAFMGFADQVSTAGDVNNDGYADVLVGTICDSNGQPCEGRVRLYLGSSTGLSTTPAWIGEGNQDNAYFGVSLSGAGDVNADGYADVVIGAPGYTNGQTEEGVVFMFHGSAAGLETNAAIMIEFNLAFAGFGASVAGAGDTNGDGYADVIVGIPNYTGGQAGEGAAAVYRGSATGVQGFYAWFAESNQAPSPGFNDGTAFGGSVSTAGDVDGDGRSDVIVGARNWDNPTHDEGAAFLYLGSGGGITTPEAVRFEADQLNSSFGGVVAAAGDVDGDGRSDVLVSANSFDNGETNEGRVFLYRGAGSLPQSSAQLLGAPNPGGANVGRSVAMGDVNRDGYSDIIVGASTYSGGLNGQGKVSIYRGTMDGPSPVPDWEVFGTQASEVMGQSVASAGDVNGDGFDDVLVGSRLYSGALPRQGKASLFYGGALMSTTPAWSVLGPAADAGLGVTVAPAGDVNGDGYADVLVGAELWSRVYLYLGSPSGPSLQPAWQRNGSYYGFYPIVAASAGDVNGDGYSDVLVGSPGQSSGGLSYNGEALLFLGSPSGLSVIAAWAGTGESSYNHFGQSVATAGDVNGDGYSDVIVGAPNDKDHAVFAGRAYVYLGAASGLMSAAQPHRVYLTDLPGFNYLGLSLGTAGDVDGDGFSDVLIGSPFYVAPQPNAGRVMIYRGSSAGLALTPAWTRLGANLENGEFGRSTAGAGDVNADGFSDVVIGSPGYAAQGGVGGVFFHYGNGGAGAIRMIEQAHRFVSTRIALLGLSDAENAFELATYARSAGGRARVAFQSEVKPLSVAFDGSGLGTTSYFDSGVPVFITGSYIPLRRWISGVVEGSPIRWRLRAASNDPFFPRSPWMSISGNAISEKKLRMPGCVDSDGDGIGAMPDASCTSSLIDCNDRNGVVWQSPGETSHLTFMDKSTFLWLSPADTGTSAPLTYDALRSSQLTFFDTCLVTFGTTSGESIEPSPGQRFYYLTRARNGCPAVGSLGTTTAGQERMSVTCP